MERSAEAVRCRACQYGPLEVMLSLGKQPRANAFLLPDQLGGPEPRYPLELAFCPDCTLVQIIEHSSPEELFSEYAYFSSNSETMVAHVGALARRLISERQLGSSDLVVEVASNDGYLLQHYQRAGIPVLGIDPARNVAEAAEARGVPTRCEFFGLEMARRLRDEGVRASVVHANNVLAHVPDLNGFVAGMATIVDRGGVVVIETPYVRELVDRLEFDTIYHEHLFYYSVSSLRRVLERNGLWLVAVEPVAIHGGSLRAFAVSSPTPADPTVEVLVAEEERAGVTQADYYRRFAAAVERHCADVRHRLRVLVDEGYRLAAYGAAAKGTVLLNAAGIGTETLEFVADRSPYKQGRLMPGVHVPIVAPEHIVESMPDYVVLLAWNFADEIVSQQQEYLRRGGRFILPVPGLRTIP